MTTTVKKNTHARINDDMFLEITWARIFNNSKSAKKAQFSGDLYTNSGVKICTINRLCILHTVDNTGKPAIYVGSMFETLPKGDTIYALSWFPDAKKGSKEDIIARENFANECINAIAAFHKIEMAKMELVKENKNQSHPNLKTLIEASNKVTNSN